MRRFRTTLAIALCVVSLAVSAEAAVKRDVGTRETIVAKILKQLKRALLPTSQDDFGLPKP
jgi:hypothetical protein